MRKPCFISEKAPCTFRGERVILHKYTKGINTVVGGKKSGGSKRWTAVSDKGLFWHKNNMRVFCFSVRHTENFLKVSNL